MKTTPAIRTTGAILRILFMIPTSRSCIGTPKPPGWFQGYRISFDLCRVYRLTKTPMMRTMNPIKLRFIAEALGAQVTYRKLSPDTAEVRIEGVH